MLQRVLATDVAIFREVKQEYSYNYENVRTILPPKITIFSDGMVLTLIWFVEFLSKILKNMLKMSECTALFPVIHCNIYRRIYS
jgi:hypothetical protein